MNFIFELEIDIFNHFTSNINKRPMGLDDLAAWSIVRLEQVRFMPKNHLATIAM